MHCTTLHCIGLHWTWLQCIGLHLTTSNYIALHWTAGVQCSTKCAIFPHYCSTYALHYNALHWTRCAILPHYRSTAITVINATTTRLRHTCLSSLAPTPLSMHNSYLVTTIFNGISERTSTQKLAKARKTRKSPDKLGLKKFGPGKGRHP